MRRVRVLGNGVSAYSVRPQGDSAASAIWEPQVCRHLDLGLLSSRTVRNPRLRPCGLIHIPSVLAPGTEQRWLLVGGWEEGTEPWASQ